MPDLIQILIFVVIALVYFVQWIARQGANKNDSSNSDTGRSAQEEKMRRFMEALGVPQDQLPQQREEPPTTPPPPPGASARQTPPPVPAGQQPPAPPRRTSSVPDAYKSEEHSWEVESAPETATLDAWGDRIQQMRKKAEEAEQKFASATKSVANRAGGIGETELGKTEVGMNEVGSGGAAVGETPQTSDQQREENAYAIMADLPVGQASTFRQLLQTSTGAKQAVVLREILGPPKSQEQIQ